MGALLLVQPLFNFAAVENLIGVFQIVRGIVNVLLAFMLKINRDNLEAMLDDGSSNWD